MSFDHVFDKKISVGWFVNHSTNLPIEHMEVHRESLEKAVCIVARLHQF